MVEVLVLRVDLAIFLLLGHLVIKDKKKVLLCLYQKYWVNVRKVWLKKRPG
jgi:hypothetical protein